MTVEIERNISTEQTPSSEQINTDNIDRIISLTSTIAVIGGLAIIADSISDYIHNLPPVISAYAGAVMIGGGVVLNLSNNRPKKEENV